MTLRIQPGETCLAAGRVITIDGWDSLNTVSARDTATGHLLQVPIHQLEPLPATSSSSQNHLTVPQLEWDRCVALANALRPYAECYALPQEAMREISHRFSISPRHVQRLRQKFRPDSKPSVLVRDKGGRPQGMHRLPAAVEHAIQHVITKNYARRERTSQQEIVLRARSLCRRLHLTPPSRKTVLARIAAHQGRELDRRRFGKQAANQRWEARPGQQRVNGALDQVQIDHTLVDLMVLSDDRKEVLGRPWLTVAVDVATRVVLGCLIYAPSQPPQLGACGACAFSQKMTR